MYGDYSDRSDLHRLADDGCPHVATWDSADSDLSPEALSTGKDDRNDR